MVDDENSKTNDVNQQSLSKFTSDLQTVNHPQISSSQEVLSFDEQQEDKSYQGSSFSKRKRKKSLMIIVPLMLFLLLITTFVLYFSGSENDNSKDSLSEIFSNIKDPNSATNHNNLSNLNRGIFAVHEGNTLNVYSSSLDGLDDEIILSRDIGETNKEPNQSIRAAISRDGEYLAYKFPAGDRVTLEAPSTVSIMRIADKSIVGIIEHVESFDWDADNITLKFTRRKSEPENLSIEAPLYPSSSVEHYSYNLNSNQEYREEENIYGNYVYLVDINDKEVLTRSSSPYGGQPDRLSVYDISTNEERQIDMLDNEQVSIAITNGSKTRTVVSLLPKNWGVNYSCNIYELRNYKLHELVHKENYDCTTGRGSFYWDGDDQFFYSMGTGPNGRVRQGESTASGLYVIDSVYKYDFGSKTNNVVLNGDVNRAYSIYGILSGKVMIVNEISGVTDEKILQFRDLDGSNPVELVKINGNDTPYFIGWAK